MSPCTDASQDRPVPHLATAHGGPESELRRTDLSSHCEARSRSCRQRACSQGLLGKRRFAGRSREQPSFAVDAWLKETQGLVAGTAQILGKYGVGVTFGDKYIPAQPLGEEGRPKHDGAVEARRDCSGGGGGDRGKNPKPDAEARGAAHDFVRAGLHLGQRIEIQFSRSTRPLRDADTARCVAQATDVKEPSSNRASAIGIRTNLL